MTAPLPNMRTVLVLSEKGSRLSLPSMARAPFTLTGTSSATGCCFAAVSPGKVAGDAGRCPISGLEGEISFSLTIGDMAGTLAKKTFQTCPVRSRASQGTSICSAPAQRANIVRTYYDGNTCTSGQAKTSKEDQERRALRRERRKMRGKIVEVSAKGEAGSARQLQPDSR